LIYINSLILRVFHIQSIVSICKQKNFTQYKNMTAAFLPAILVPLVGLVFPAFSMALFFIYVSVDDID
jgi:photosystem I subunit 8